MPVRIVGMIGVTPPRSDAALHVIEGGLSPSVDNAGKRLMRFAMEQDIHDERLWMPIARSANYRRAAAAVDIGLAVARRAEALRLHRGIGRELSRRSRGDGRFPRARRGDVAEPLLTATF